MNKEEETTKKNPTSQSDMNERLPTQDRCPTPKELATMGRDDTFDYDCEASNLIAATELRSNNSNNDQAGDSGRLTAGAVDSEDADATAQGAASTHVVSPPTPSIPFISVDVQCDWLNNGGNSSPITNNSSISYYSDTDSIFHLFHDVQEADGTVEAARKSRGDTAASDQVQSTSTSHSSVNEGDSVSKSKKTSRGYETTPQKSKELKPSDTPVSSPDAQAQSEIQRDAPLGEIAMVHGEVLQDPLHQQGQLFPASPEAAPRPRVTRRQPPRQRSTWSRSPSPESSLSPSTPSLLECVQAMTSFEHDWCNHSLRSEDMAQALLDILQSHFPRKPGQPFESYIDTIQQALRTIDVRVYEVYGKFL